MDSIEPDHYENNVAVYNLWGEELVKLDDHERIVNGKDNHIMALQEEIADLYEQMQLNG